MDYNHKLCEERHERIDEVFKNTIRRLEKVENRFILFLTLLITNLLGVCGTLFVLLTKGQ